MDYPKTTSREIIVMIQTMLIALLMGEMFFIGKIIGELHIAKAQVSEELVFFGIPTLTTLYIFFRSGFKKLKLILSSGRFDLFLTFALILTYSIYNSSFGKEIYVYHIGKISPKIMELVAVSLALVVFVVILKKIVEFIFDLIPKKKYPNDEFIKDVAVRSVKEDILEYKNRAIEFVNNIESLELEQSVVFGIDAPWGVGKTSFINMCEDVNWKNNKNIIYYHFESIKHTDNENLFDFFVSGLIAKIRENVFAPELVNNFDEYLNLILDGKANIFGFEIGFRGRKSADELFNQINSFLRKTNKRIIVVIDDLDRLHWENTKQFLFGIKQSFALSNIVYIVCFDSKNIVSAKGGEDEAKTLEFLEKFIQIKFSLFVNLNHIIQFLENQKTRIERESLITDPRNIAKITSVITILIELIRQPNNNTFIRYINNLRKAKIFINALTVIKLHKIDLMHQDFHEIDLLNIFILSIYYPNIIRDLYTYETNGRNGNFSVIKEYNYQKNKRVYRNSEFYKDYKKNLTESEKEILSELFDVNNNEFSESDFETMAKFNGLSGNNNLDRYLKLIVDGVKLDDSENERFYRNLMENFYSSKSPISIFFNDDIKKFENKKYNLLTAIVNNTSKLENIEAIQIIDYLVNSFHDFSNLSLGGFVHEARDNLVYYLLRLLNDFGHIKTLEDRRLIDDKIIRIAGRIFGDGEFKENGIIDRMLNESRGILGFYDVMMFRLYSCATRGGNLFNLYKSLYIRSTNQSEYKGDTTILDIEGMRQLSQYIFKIFKSRYIENKINIFNEINKIRKSEITGEQAFPYSENFSDAITYQKTKITVFLIYQLSNRIKVSGIGCGYYDEQGKKDAHGIFKAMNNYLFGVCFNTTIDENNLLAFIDFMLMNYTNDFDNGKYQPSIGVIQNSIDMNKLLKYLKKHKQKILELKTSDRFVIRSSSVLSYKENIDPLVELIGQIEPAEKSGEQ